MRTSQTHPLEIASISAGPGYGRIGVTFCPGKHDRAAMSGAWARDLAADLDAIKDWGAQCVLTLVEPHELVALRVPDLGAEVLAREMDWLHLPIPDYSTPDALFERIWRSHGREIRALLRAGGNIVIHCKGGLGRAGMMAARLLAELGTPADEAIRIVRRARNGAIETSAQRDLVRATQAVVDVDAIDSSALQRIGRGLGSNPAGIFADREGRGFYVKSVETPEHARNEILAAKLYLLAGAPTLTYVRSANPLDVATELAQLQKKSIADFTLSELRQARRWFGVHAWTANWDAAGFHGDNQGVIDGIVVTLDVGGALVFRAQGDPKGKAFGAEVGELERLRCDPSNPHAVKLFAAITPAELREAIAVVTRIPDAAIRRTIEQNGGDPALADKMIARKAFMAKAATNY